MRPLFKREKKSPEDFGWADLLYVPENPKDWFGIGCLIFIFVVVFLTVSSVDRYNREVTDLQIQQSQHQEIAALKHLTSATFLQYLTGFWQMDRTSGLVEIKFFTPKKGVLEFPTQNGPKKIPISIIPDSTSLGVVSFSLENGELGTIKKVWNQDAIILQMPDSKPEILHYVLAAPLSVTR